ncbi:MAG: hypothetical protein E7585_03505 [Ruminococcaceae bacterium]|nr:hypothetical protein [Oscillospiraceae bacterium]
MEENKKQDNAVDEAEKGSLDQVKKNTKKKKKRAPLSPANKKKLIAAIVAVALVIAILTTVLVVRAVKNNRAPELATVRDRYIELISNAHAVNEILWGEGLPTYPRIYSTGFSFKDSYGEGDKKTEKNISGFVVETEEFGTIVAYHAWMFFIPPGEEDGIYYDFEKDVTLSGKPDEDDFYRFAVRVEEEREGEQKNTYLAENIKTEEVYYYYDLEEFDLNSLWLYTEKDEPYYDYVKENCGYLFVDDIKIAAQKVYSAAMMNAINEGILTGITVSERPGGTLYPRYMDYENTESGEVFLVKFNQDEGYNLTEWVYDFDTMRILPKSNRKTVKLSVERHPTGKPEERTTKTLTFVLENGNWYLDAPSY